MLTRSPEWIFNPVRLIDICLYKFEYELDENNINI